MKKKKHKRISAEELDKKFDNGEEILQYFDTKKARWAPPAIVEIQRVNVDVPVPMIQALDKEATRIGVTRTALIKMWLAQHLDKLAG